MVRLSPTVVVVLCFRASADFVAATPANDHCLLQGRIEKGRVLHTMKHATDNSAKELSSEDHRPHSKDSNSIYHTCSHMLKKQEGKNGEELEQYCEEESYPKALCRMLRRTIGDRLILADDVHDMCDIADRSMALMSRRDEAGASEVQVEKSVSKKSYVKSMFGLGGNSSHDNTTGLTNGSVPSEDVSNHTASEDATDVSSSDGHLQNTSAPKNLTPAGNGTKPPSKFSATAMDSDTFQSSDLQAEAGDSFKSMIGDHLADDGMEMKSFDDLGKNVPVDVDAELAPFAKKLDDISTETSAELKDASSGPSLSDLENQFAEAHEETASP